MLNATKLPNHPTTPFYNVFANMNMVNNFTNLTLFFNADHILWSEELEFT